MIAFCHNDFPNLLVYCNQRYAKVLECGAPADNFDGGTDKVAIESDKDKIVVEATIDTSNDNNLLNVPILSPHNDINENIVQLIATAIRLMMTMNRLQRMYPL